MKFFSKIATCTLIAGLSFAEFNKGDFLLGAGLGVSSVFVQINEISSSASSNLSSMLLNAEAQYFLNNRFFIQADTSYNNSASGNIITFVERTPYSAHFYNNFALDLCTDMVSGSLSANYIWSDSFDFIKKYSPTYKGYLGMGLNYVSFNNSYYSINENLTETKLDTIINSKSAFGINMGSIYTLTENVNIDINSKIIFLNSATYTHNQNVADTKIPLIIKSIINFNYKF